MKLYEKHAALRDKFEVLAFHDPRAKTFEQLDEKLEWIIEKRWQGKSLPFPILLDPTGKTVKAFGIRGYPTNILIDPEGRVVKAARPERVFEKMLEELASPEPETKPKGEDAKSKGDMSDPEPKDKKAAGQDGGDGKEPLASAAPRLLRVQQEYLTWARAVSTPVVVILAYGTSDSGQSGVLISSEGHILTTEAALPKHLERVNPRVQMHGGSLEEARLIKRYPELNLALLKVEATGTPFLSISDRPAEPGSLVLAVGNSLNAYLFSGKPTINAGVVCRHYSTPFDPHGRGKPLPMKQLDLIEVDAGVNEGSYGGALVDIRGQLIGIVSRYVHATSWLFGAIDLRPHRTTILTDLGLNKTQALERPAEPLPALLSMQQTFQAAADRVAGSVVSVEAKREHKPRSHTDIRRLYRQRPESGRASGVVVRADGHIVTSWFHVKDSEEIHVTLPDGKRYRAELKGHDEVRDLAVLEIEAGDLQVPDFARAEDIVVGHFAIAVGRDDPSTSHTISTGIVSATHRHYGKTFETDAQLNFANSGGALVNSQGQLMGVTVYQTGSERHGHNSGVGFGLRTDSLMKVLPGLISGEVIKKKPVPYLGIRFGKLIAGQEGLPVGAVTENSGAERAGIKAGDRITLFNGHLITSRNSLLSNLREHDVGDTVVIHLERGDETIEVKVTLTARPKQ